MNNQLDEQKNDEVQSLEKLVVLSTQSCHSTSNLLADTALRKTRFTQHGVLIMSLTAAADIDEIGVLMNKAAKNDVLNEVLWLSMETLAINRKGNGNISIVGAVEYALATILPEEEKEPVI